MLAAIERDVNKVREYEIDAALRLVTMKLVGYTEVIHVLLPQMRDDSSILIYGGLARDRPYPGSTTVTTVNGGVTALVRTLVDDMVTVSDDDLVRAMRFLWERMKVVVEPTGALGLAAVLTGKVAVAGKKVGVVLSGGNVDLAQALALFERLPSD